jgi:hypothetical protein
MVSAHDALHDDPRLLKQTVLDAETEPQSAPTQTKPLIAKYGSKADALVASVRAAAIAGKRTHDSDEDDSSSDGVIANRNEKKKIDGWLTRSRGGR